MIPVAFVMAVLMGVMGFRGGHTRLVKLLMVIGAVLFVGIGCGPLTSCLLRPLQSPYVQQPKLNWQGRNVVVLLGAGAMRAGQADAYVANQFAFGRMQVAAAQYLACKRVSPTCFILISGGDASQIGRSEAQVYADNLAAMGVARADMVLEMRSRNTWQNAAFSSALLPGLRADHIYLVTSATHLTRSLSNFRHFGVRATPIGADLVAAEWSYYPKMYNFMMADIALHEYAGIVRDWVLTHLGFSRS